MVADYMIWYRVMLVTEEEAGPDGLGRDVQWLTVFSTQMMGYWIHCDQYASRRHCAFWWVSLIGWASKPISIRRWGGL